MRKLIPRNLIIIISGLTLFLLSCSPEACFEATDSSLKAVFWLKTGGKRQAPDSLTVYGLNMESNKLYNKTKNTVTALLPLNTATGNCTYIIIINDITDTIELRYNSFPHLISKECGYTYYHNFYSDSLVYTTNAIDTIEIIKNTVTTINEENIRILY